MTLTSTMTTQKDEIVTSSGDYALCISLIKLEGRIPTSLVTQIFPQTGIEGYTPVSELTVGVDLKSSDPDNSEGGANSGGKERLLATKLCVISDNDLRDQLDDNDHQWIESRDEKCIRGKDPGETSDLATVVGVWEESIPCSSSYSFEDSTGVATTGNTFEVPIKNGDTDFTVRLDLSSIIAPGLIPNCNDGSTLQWGTATLTLPSATLSTLKEAVPSFDFPDETSICVSDSGDSPESPTPHEPMKYPTNFSLDAVIPESTEHVDLRVPVFLKNTDNTSPSDMILHLRVHMQDELLLAIRNGMLRANLGADTESIMRQPALDDSPLRQPIFRKVLFNCLGADFVDIMKHFLCIDKDDQHTQSGDAKSGSGAMHDPGNLIPSLSLNSSIDTFDKYSPGAPFDVNKEVKVEIASWVEPPKDRSIGPIFFDD